MNKTNIKTITSVAMLISVEIIMSRFLAITTPIVKISFAFIPIVIIAHMYGPLYSSLAAAIADIIGALLFPVGPYFLGFTVTAFLAGLTYGLFLYKRNVTKLSIVTMVLTISIVLNLGLDTLWLYIITGKAFLVLLLPRIMKTLLMFPFQISVIYLVIKKSITIKKLIYNSWLFSIYRKYGNNKLNLYKFLISSLSRIPKIEK